MKDKSTVDLRGRLNHINDQMGKALEEAKTDAGGYEFANVTSLEGDTAQAKVEKFRALNDEATDIGKELDERRDLAATADAIEQSHEVVNRLTMPNGKPSAAKGDEVKSIGQLFTEHENYGKADPGHMGKEIELSNLDMKAALFQTSGGWAAPSIRSDRVVPFAVRPLVITDLLPVVDVSLPTYIYMEETTFTNSAVEVAEAASKPEVALSLTERTETLRKIAGYLPVTDEQLEDVPAARQYIDNRLGYMIKQRLETQVISGNGAGVNIVGINHSARSGIQQQAKAGDTTIDATYKAMTKIRVNAFSEPSGALFHPNDWQDVRLALASGSGIYLFGPPSDPGPERIFGVPVVLTTGETEGTALVGDFNQAALLLRQGLTMKVGYVNDDLIKNRQTIVAEMRAAVAVFRPAAFCEVTGV